MITTDDLRFFARISAETTLTAAARALNVTPSAVTQRLKQVEGRAGVRLIDRSARRLQLTNEGELVAARGRTILNEIDDLVEDLAARKDSVAGHLRLIAPLPFGRRFIAPAVSQFRVCYPDVKVDLYLSDRPIAGTGENFDITIHIGDLPDSSLVMQKLAPNRRILCASPSYLSRRGTPETPSDLRRHDCIVIRENNEDVTMWRLTGHGKTEHLRIDPVLSTNEGEVARAWALEGQGILIRSEWDVAGAVQAGQLIHLLPDYSLPDANVVALLGHRYGRAARTTSFLKMLHENLTPVPWRQV